LNIFNEIEVMIIKVGSKHHQLPLQAIHLSTPGWGGDAVKMEDGAVIQPAHCLPFVEGSTYGLELLYPYETECHVVNNEEGIPRFERELNEELKGWEFLFFSPEHHAKFYMLNTQLDIVPPPGHVIRTEPHPRYFTDDNGTVPLPMIGHLQNEWYPRPLFVVFRAPRPGQRHIFRKGEPIAQLLFVPQEAKYEITRMNPEEEAARAKMMEQIQSARKTIANRRWFNSTKIEQDNHYKVLAAAFAKGGQTEVERKVREGLERHSAALPHEKSIAECLEIGRRHFQSSHYMDAVDIFTHVISRDPKNAEALNHLAICAFVLGNIPDGLNLMAQAVNAQPNSPKYHRDLAEMLRRLGHFQEAEASFRASLQLYPDNADALSLLGLAQAQQGRLAEALLSCQAAAILDRSMPAVQVRLAYVLSKLQRIEEARAAFETARAIDPNLDVVLCLGLQRAEVEAILH
jgi:tetratricopeptide (TPR) repeat protein